MQCKDVDRLATAYVDGELDDHRSSALRGHLRVCDGCAARVEDEAAVRDAAGGLSPMDPPADLWSAIDARLAQEEIGDARRPRLVLWWQRVVDAARRHMVPVGVATAAAAALLAVWVTRSSTSTPTGTSPITSTTTTTSPSTTTSPIGCGETYRDQLACEARASDRRYQDAIRDLEAAIGTERAAWSPADAARFDARAAELDRATSDELKRLAVKTDPSPADRDALSRLYQDKLDLLSRAAVFGEPIARAR
jgi:hypothetical protein